MDSEEFEFDFDLEDEKFVKDNDTFISQNLTNRCLNSVVRIELGIVFFTGFFMKLSKNDQNFYFLITNGHNIPQEQIDSNSEIEIELNEKKKIIKLDKKQRFIKCYKNTVIDIDITVIQIFDSDNIIKDNNYYLLPDLKYKDKEGNNIYKNEKIICIGFPRNKEGRQYSSGKINNIKDYEFTYFGCTDKGNSGSPLLNDELLIIGIHSQGPKEELDEKKSASLPKKGYFIGPIVDDLLSNEIKNIEIFLSKETQRIMNIKNQNEFEKRLVIILFTFFIICITTLFLLSIIYIFQWKKTLYYEDKITIKYKGYLKDELFDGFGILYSRNGTKIFEGYWKKGKYNGKGTLFYDNGNIQYEGEWEDNNKNGKGSLYYDNGIIQYEGEWKDNKRNGKGTLFFKNGKKKYEGYWKNDKKHGKGLHYFLYKDNYLEIRDICEDKLVNEDDVIEYKNRFYDYEYEHKCYEGEFDEDKKNGKGTYYYYNGVEKYVGDWKNDKKDGKGTLRDRNQRLIYYGEFSQNRKIFGSLYDEEGIKFFGHFENDQYEGFGTLYNNKEKYKIQGYFKNGELNGESTMFLKNGLLEPILLEGSFINGKLDGFIKFYNTESYIINILFENGVKNTLFEDRLNFVVVKKNNNDIIYQSINQKDIDFVEKILKEYSIFKI